MSANEWHGLGRLTGDPEVSLHDGRRRARFTVATNRKWTDRRTGQPREEATFHRVHCWGQPAEFIAEHGRTGTTVYVRGPMKRREWDDAETGERRSMVYCEADWVEIPRQPPGHEGGARRALEQHQERRDNPQTADDYRNDPRRNGGR